MPQNTLLKITQPKFICAVAITIVIFTVMNPAPTIAQNAATPWQSKRFFQVGLIPGFKTGCETVQGKQSSRFKGSIILSAAALKMIALVNQERMEAGLTKLEIDMTLVKLAVEKSWDMVRFNYFGHYSRRLGTIYNQLDRAQLQYISAAENLIGAPNLTRAVQAVLSSPAHRGNILNPHFRKIGVGITRGGPYGKMFVQIFVE